MRLTTSILQSLGCFGKTTTKNEHELSNEMKKQSATSAETSKHIPIDQELTEQCIDSTSDDDLLQLIFDHLSKKLSVDYRNEYETVMSWNSSMQAIYMIWVLETEVNNGGYNQFYFNSSGPFYTHLPEALRRVGATQFANLSERANKVFEIEKTTILQNQSPDPFSESDEDDPLDPFDTEFYALYQTENLEQIQVEYIRNHTKEFIYS